MAGEIEQKETDPTPEPEVKTPTPEEIKAEYEVKLAEITKERDEKDKGLKTAHSQLTKKDQELKSQADINTRLDGMDETQRILAAMIAEKGTGEEIEPEKRSDYLAKFDEIAKRNKEEKDNALRQTQQNEYAQQAQAIYAKANEAFPDDDGRLLRVERFLDKGMPDEAEKIIAKAVEKKTTDTKEEKNVESEEERINKAVEEKLRQKMEEAGMLTSETGGPSGASLDDAKWFDEVYGAGKSDDHERANKIKQKMKSQGG